jgi:hypothetical protein
MLGIHSGHPWPSPDGQLRCAHRQSCRCVEPRGDSSTHCAPPDTQKPPFGGLRVFGGERGFTRAIHGPRPMGSFAVRIGNPADASNPAGIRPPTALRQIRKSPLSGAFAYLAERGGFTRAIHGPRPMGSFAVRIGNPADASNPVGIRPPTALRQIRKSPLSGAFAYLAERGGFEPPKRGLDAYTLSRRAPSTTRTPLRIFPGVGVLPRLGRQF